uniref:Uncharacterized protein n=1 Tax=Knipowitschia caucasica TaxID=637954 RepID=A0AAV2LUR1_KNICA
MEETGAPGGNQSTWRKPEHLEETGAPHRSTWRKPEHLEETGAHEGNRSTWRKSEHLEETGAPGGNQSTWRKPEHLEETGAPGGNLHGHGEKRQSPHRKTRGGIKPTVVGNQAEFAK